MTYFILVMIEGIHKKKSSVLYLRLNADGFNKQYIDLRASFLFQLIKMFIVKTKMFSISALWQLMD